MYSRLVALCNQKGMTPTQLCKMVTNSAGNLATWKKGYMRSDYLLACADVLGVTTDYLLGHEPKAVQGIDIEERALLGYFRQCSESDRAALLDLAGLYAEREQASKSKRAE